ncbi:MAG: hypothetical protein R6U25_12315 [Alkalispirochaeta sp.]
MHHVYRSSLRLTVCCLLIAGLLGAGLSADDQPDPRDGPDWIPVGSVSPEVERRALETRARLESRSPGLQRQALRMIRSDIETYGRASMRLAATPLVVDLLGMEYRILETPQGYTVDAPTRLLALQVLADLGGEPARGQLRESVRIDADGTVRASAAQLLARIPGSDPDSDYRTVGETLLRAVKRNDSPEEIARLLSATQQLSGRVWNAEHPAVLEALVALSGGTYSSSIRRRAMSFLEDLSAR